ncbi:unnamed protein product [Rotaria sordida]|nr:unnamed protein product [Rotaria sordida]
MSDHLEMNDTSTTPVIFFINKLSGGQKGQQVYRMLVRLLNPRQVFLLENDTTIIQALNIYSSLNNTRICICGGDGTVSWILSHLVDAFPPLKNPPASICPLGTGNDLSRVLGWGYRYELRQLLRTLTQITRAHPVPLDRWKIQIETLETNASSKHFGLDAAVVLDFHVRRTRDPSKFTSPFKNKILYINEARKYFKEFAFGMAWDLREYIRLICDGQDLTDSMRHCHSFVVLNTPSFGSGTRPWGRISTKRISSQSTNQRYEDSFDQTSIHSFQTHDSPVNGQDGNQTTALDTVTHPVVDHFKTQDFGDRKIEVIGLSTIQMALIHLGFRGNCIAQCSQVRIELNHPMPVHMDGEPFCLAESFAVNITHAGQVMVLRNEKR